MSNRLVQTQSPYTRKASSVINNSSWIPYLIMGLHALYTGLTLHTLPRIGLDDGNHFICQFCAWRVTYQSKTRVSLLWCHFLFSSLEFYMRLQWKIQWTWNTRKQLGILLEFKFSECKSWLSYIVIQLWGHHDSDGYIFFLYFWLSSYFFTTSEYCHK